MIYCGQFGERILLLVKFYTINLLMKSYIWVVRSGNIIIGKKLHN
jgi:hypothetical protein